MKTLDQRGAAVTAGAGHIIAEVGPDFRLLVVLVGPEGTVTQVTFGGDEKLILAALASIEVMKAQQPDQHPAPPPVLQ